MGVDIAPAGVGGGGEVVGADGGAGSEMGLEAIASAKALLGEWVELVAGAPDGAARAVPLRWVSAARHAVRLAVRTPVSSGLSKGLVDPMRAAVLALVAGDENATVPLHADYLALCVHAKCYDEAMLFSRGGLRIEHHPATTCVSAADVLCEQYYLAVVHAVCRRYPEALQSCRLALAVPSSSLSDVAVAVYRKFLLISLLSSGALPPHPRVSSYTASRLRAYASEYMDLGKAFEAASMDDARKIAASHHRLFVEHGNAGLVARVLAALPRRKIIALTTSFVTMRLDGVAARARLPGGAREAERLLADMVAAGEVVARVDARRGIVRFPSSCAQVSGGGNGGRCSSGSVRSVQEHDAAAARAAAAARVWAGGAAAGGEGGEGDGRGGAVISAERMTSGVNAALSCVERIQGFRNAVLCDPAFIAHKLASERDNRMHAGGLAGGLQMGIEDDHEIEDRAL